MKTIIAGSRHLTVTNEMIDDMVSLFPQRPTIIISGTARGIDSCGESWAIEKHLPLVRLPADWTRYGRAAGYHRNINMAAMAEALLLVWDGKSKGSAMMKEIAEKRNLVILEYIIEEEPLFDTDQR